MRVAALAFGVVAGLVASLILALGGLDADIALQSGDDRQVALIRFGLFVIGNVGVFGAALVVATPLIGAVLLSLGAAAWIGAAILLHHGPDPVMITPPALLILAAVVAIVAHLRSTPRDFAARGEPASATPDPTDFDALPPVPVAAGFFGSDGASAAEPTEPAVDGALAGIDQTEQIDRGESWNPRKKKKPPPRQEPMFLPAEGDEEQEEQEGLLARIARTAASFLSFGLYAGLAGAAVLVFWNLRSGDTTHPSVATVDIPAASSSALSSVSLAPTTSSSSVPPSSSASEPASALPGPAFGPATVSSSSLLPPSSSAEPARVVRPVGVVVEQPKPVVTIPSSSEEPAPSSVAPVIASSEEPSVVQPTTGTSTAPQPFTMTPRMAAERAKPRPAVPARTTTESPPPQGLTGL